MAASRADLGLGVGHRRRACDWTGCGVGSLLVALASSSNGKPLRQGGRDAVGERQGPEGGAG